MLSVSLSENDKNEKKKKKKKEKPPKEPRVSPLALVRPNITLGPDLVGAWCYFEGVGVALSLSAARTEWLEDSWWQLLEQTTLESLCRLWSKGICREQQLNKAPKLSSQLVVVAADPTETDQADEMLNLWRLRSIVDVENVYKPNNCMNEL